MHMATRQGNIDTIWYNYVKNGVLFDQSKQPRGVRPLIINSWKRCRSVDPVNYERFILPEKSLETRLAINQKLISIAVPIIQDISSIGGKNCILLCDNEGYVLETISNCDYTIPPGIKCSEEYLGTNAVGTALIEGGPVEIHGFEHFKSMLHTFSCAAVPIRDPEEEIIGLIDITNPFGKLPSGVIRILKLGVQVIEHQLRWEKEREKRKETEAVLGVIKDSMEHCMLTVDSRGKITDANQKILDLVGKRKDNLIGVDFQDILKKGIAFAPGKQFDLRFNSLSLPCRVVRQEKITTSYGTDKSILLFTTNTTDTTNENTIQSSISQAKSFKENIIGEAAIWRKLMARATKAAKVPSNVLIEGDSGTGKELIAKAIHLESGRTGSFVPINCGAVPKELIESELFGYEDGAFTGAKKGGKIGKFEMADKGTLFLDEIGEMTPDMQVRLLRVLQDKRITPVGGTKSKFIDARILAATNRNLWQEVLNGGFREDLYYRLNVIHITVPPLKARKDDIPLLANNFVQKFCHQFNKPVMQIDDEVMELLYRYDWPGNVRELSNIIENAVVFTEGNVILDDILPPHIKEFVPMPTITDTDNQGLKEYEKEIIAKTLEINKGNVSKTARDLGIARNTLYRKMKKMGLD
ncbi:MAG TPA: sigma-54-dependent Fis family transcriptional regulator [Syntrophomonadaceae bacterium]|nr:sigma-54-dependent Fis family transcriptional regulator [Syntrophomonadaceae bacterium]